MTTLCTCCNTRPVADTFVCTDCIDTLHGHLASIDTLAGELEVELTRRSRKTSGPHARSFDTPLPYNRAASLLLDELWAMLTAVIRELSLDDPTRQPEATLPAMTAWLIAAEPTIAIRESGGRICIDVGGWCARATRVIDTPPERIYIGPCECGAPLYATRGATIHRCPTCHATYSVAACIEARERFASDYRLTAREIETVTAGRVRAKRVDKWCERGHLQRDGSGRIRFGDVLACEARRAA